MYVFTYILFSNMLMFSTKVVNVLCQKFNVHYLLTATCHLRLSGEAISLFTGNHDNQNNNNNNKLRTCHDQPIHASLN